MKSKIITSRRDADGGYSRLTENGWEKELPLQNEFGPNFPDGEPVYDPENPPMTEEHLARRRNIPQVRTLRRKIFLTQEEFAQTFHIPIGTLRDWEQHRSEPDAPARAYLKVIAADPKGVAATLKANAKTAAE